MTTDVSICNMALDHVGTKATIQALDEQSKEARVCNRHYDPTLRATLRLHDWGFASHYIQLTSMEYEDTDQTGGWQFIYKYPNQNECLRIRELIPETSAHQAGMQTYAYQSTGYRRRPPPVKFALNDFNGQRAIFTHLEDAWARTTRFVNDPTRFDAMFVDAFAYALAAKIASPLGARSRVSGLNELRDMTIAEASGADANEGPEDTNTEADWISARA